MFTEDARDMMFGGDSGDRFMQVDRFTSRARAVFYARIVFDALALGVLLYPEWGRPLGVLLPEGLYVYLFLLGGHIASYLMLGHRGDRIVVFVSLCMDLLVLLYLATHTGGLGSPVMQGQLVYTVFFAVLYPSPLAILPPLLTLPALVKVQQLLGAQVTSRDLLLLLWCTFVNSVIVSFVVYLDRRRRIHLQEVYRLQEQSRQAVLEEERARIAREMHDGLGALISSVVIQAEYLKTQFPEGGALVDEITELHEAGRESMEELRRTVSMMREDFDPVALLEEYAHTWSHRHHMYLEWKVEGMERSLTPDKALCFHRILQESLNNIAKHADADKVEVRLEFDQQEVSLTVIDNGKGFDLRESRQGHYGLENMKKRAAHHNGTVEIESEPSKGSIVKLSLPLEPGPV